MSTGPILEFRGEHRFLSNFYPSRVVITLPVWGAAPLGTESTPHARLDGPTVEHVFQAAKAPRGPELEAILNASTSGDAKRLGRDVRVREDWESVKRDVMLACLRAKFRPRSGLAAQLVLGTGNRMLVEGNTWGDRVWGATWSGWTPEKGLFQREGMKVWARERDQGMIRALTGENWLGRLLMLVRAELDCETRS
jgi:ribA/ribD-fused uncharacterized protein